MFSLDDRIQSTCFDLGDWPLSRVLLKNEQAYPWFILVPRKVNVQEIYQLEKADREALMEEINQLSLIINDFFKPDKLNIGALGNVVPQLHVHVVARMQHDALWPQGIWQSLIRATPYHEKQIEPLLFSLRELVSASAFHGK